MEFMGSSRGVPASFRIFQERPSGFRGIPRSSIDVTDSFRRSQRVGYGVPGSFKNVTGVFMWFQGR